MTSGDPTMREFDLPADVLDQDEDTEDDLVEVAEGLVRVSRSQLEHLIYNDPLTGLPNRRRFMERLEQVTARGSYSARLAAVAVADINRFKMLNDTRGPEAGDRVLREMGDRLLRRVRDGDWVARLGNDEYGLLLTDIARPEDVVPVVEKLLGATHSPVDVPGGRTAVSLSIGIAIFPTDAVEPHRVLEHAYVALSHARQAGGNSYHFFTEQLNREVLEFVTLERHLARALERDEFELHFQPYVSLAGGHRAGMEALLRWQSPDLGPQPPGRFIPVLEKTGMIIEIGAWVIDEVCRRIAHRRRVEAEDVPVSLNLSPLQFQCPELVATLRDALRRHDVPASSLVLEVTESTFMRDIDATAFSLKRLKSMGLSVAIDDFGTGYSSLSYLKRLPVDFLKIDQSFTRDLPGDPDSTSIAGAIIQMAHSLNLRTIAEGIETEAQREFYACKGCDFGQGYLFGRPAPGSQGSMKERTYSQYS